MNSLIPIFLIVIIVLLSIQLVLSAIGWRKSYSSSEQKLDSKSFHQLNYKMSFIFQSFLVATAVIGFLGIDLNENISSYRAELEDLRNEYELIYESQNNLKNSIASLRDSSGVLKDQISSLDGDISRVKINYRSLNNEITNSTSKFHERMGIERIKQRLAKINKDFSVSEESLNILMSVNMDASYYRDYREVFLLNYDHLDNNAEFNCFFLKNFSENVASDMFLLTQLHTTYYSNRHVLFNCFDQKEFDIFIANVIKHLQLQGGLKENLTKFTWWVGVIHMRTALIKSAIQKQSIARYNAKYLNSLLKTQSERKLVLRHLYKPDSTKNIPQHRTYYPFKAFFTQAYFDEYNILYDEALNHKEMIDMVEEIFKE